MYRLKIIKPVAVKKSTVSVRSYEKRGRKRPSRYKVAVSHVPVDRKVRLFWFRVEAPLPSWHVVAAPTSVNLRDGFIEGPRGAVARLVASLPDELVLELFDSEEVSRLLDEAAKQVKIELVEPWGGEKVVLKVKQGLILGTWYSVGRYRVMCDIFDGWFSFFGEEPPPPESGEWKSHELPKGYCEKAGCVEARAWRRGDEVVVLQVERDSWGAPDTYLYWWMREMEKR